jgi:hypothetical protein
VLEANQMSIFRAYARGVPGDSLVTSIEWTASGGSIALDGTYSSPTTGDFRVVGKRHGPTRTTSDTAIVTVVPTQPSVTAVLLSPASSSVMATTQEAFAATGKLSDGSIVSIGVTWTATGGSIDAGGVYTAGSTVGTYSVTAKAASANVSATVPVTVTSAPPPPPPSSTTSGGGPGPNEPSGMTPLFARSWATLAENSWLDNGVSVVSDAGAPSSTVGRMLFPAGSGTTSLAGNAPGYSSREGFGSALQYKRFYWKFWIKLSSNWYGHCNASKTVIAWTGNAPKFVLGQTGCGTATQVLAPRLQNLAGSGGAINLPNNLGDGTISRGAWHMVEMEGLVNTASSTATDGQLYWWVDGHPVGSATNIAWNGPSDVNTWTQYMWEPIWGGGASSIPADQWMYMDDLYVSGRNN